MRLQISYKCINEDYSQEYADKYEQGKPSVNNKKYHWAISFEVPDVIEISKPDEAFKLKAELEDCTELQKEIENIYILRVKTKDGQKDYAVSKAILNKTHEAYRENEDVKRFYFYLNNHPDTVEVLKGVYLTKEEAYGEGFVVI
jgi:hypothetical protein